MGVSKIKNLIVLVFFLASPEVMGQIKDEWTQISGKVTKRYRDKKSSFLDNSTSLKNFNSTEYSVGISLYTDGVGGNFYWRPKESRFSKWQLSIKSVHHEKEVKQKKKGEEFRKYGVLRPYIFGKINNVYDCQMGYGKDWQLLQAVVNENISVFASLASGLSLKIEKPIYLNLFYVDSLNNNFIKSETYTEANKDKFLTNSRILGSDQWKEGLGDISVSPGVFFEPAIMFVVGESNKFTNRLVVGTNISYSFNPIQILALRPDKSFYVSFFVGLSLGFKS